MATFFGSEALVSEQGFSQTYTAGTIYTVPAGRYAKIFIQNASLPGLSGGTIVTAGGNRPIVLINNIGDPNNNTPFYEVFFEIYAGQSFTTNGSVILNWQLKEFASP
jgi:hypothetical protein